MSSAQIEYSPASNGQAAVLKLAGKVDFTNVVGLLKKGTTYIKDGSSELVVDLNGMQCAQSIVLSMLLRWLATAQQSGREVTITGMSEKLFDIARVSGVETVLPLTR